MRFLGVKKPRGGPTDAQPATRESRDTH